MKVKRKIRIDMSVEIDVFMDWNRKNEELNKDLDRIIKNYMKCLGDDDIKFEKVEFV